MISIFKSAFFFYKTTILHFYLQLFVLSSQRTSVAFLDHFWLCISCNFFFALHNRLEIDQRSTFFMWYRDFQTTFYPFSFLPFPIWDRTELESPKSWPNISFFPWFLFHFCWKGENMNDTEIGFCLSLLCLEN